jgi:hypothetical protein
VTLIDPEVRQQSCLGRRARAAVCHAQTGESQRQVTCTLTAADQVWVVGHRVLICDRDAKWSALVRERLGEAGIRVVQTPFQAPNAKGYASYCTAFV